MMLYNDKLVPVSLGNFINVPMNRDLRFELNYCFIIQDFVAACM